MAVSVDGSKTHQAMEGFGASHGALVFGPTDALAPALRTAAIDAAYGQVRLTTGNVSMGVVETPATASDPWGQQANDDGDPATFNMAGFNWTGSDAAKTKLIDLAKPKGFDGFYLGGTVSVRWANQWLKMLRGTDYARYLDEAAEQVAASHIHWRDAYGITARFDQIFNEPTTGNVELSPGSAKEMVDLVKTVGARLRKEGFASITFVAPGEETESASLASATAIMADAGARPYVGAIAYHPYPYGSMYSSIANILAASGSGKPDAGMIKVRNDLRDLGLKYGVPLWMTEVSHGGVDPRSFDSLRGRAIHIHDELVHADASAYFGMGNIWNTWAQMAHFGNKDLFGPDGEGTVVLVDDDAAKVIITGMGYAIGHYARWIKRGAVRLDATSGDPLVLVTAFRDGAQGRFVLVAINNASATRSIDVKLAGFGAGMLDGSIDGERSTASANWAAFAPATSGPAGFTADLPALSVTTFSVKLAGGPASDGGADGGSGGDSSADGGPQDGGQPDREAPGGDAAPGASGGGGCSCRVGVRDGDARSVPALFALVALALATRRRRRSMPPTLILAAVLGLAASGLACGNSNAGLPGGGDGGTAGDAANDSGANDGSAGDVPGNDGANPGGDTGLPADAAGACPDVFGTYGMLVATGPGCGDINTKAPQCIKGTAMACALHFTSTPPGGGPGGVNGGASLAADGTFKDAMLYLGTTKRSGCSGTWKATTSTMEVVCGGGGDACTVTLFRTSAACP